MDVVRNPASNSYVIILNKHLSIHVSKINLPMWKQWAVWVWYVNKYIKYVEYYLLHLANLYKLI